MVITWGITGLILAAYLSVSTCLLLWKRKKTFLVLTGILVFLGFAIPTLDPACEARQRMFCCQNLKTIAVAISAYEQVHGHLPRPWMSSASGEPLLSWRVAILPYLGEQKLYDSINKEKKWNHPDNAKIANQMPTVFRCPAARSQSKWWTTGKVTSYVGVIGKHTAWAADSDRLSADFEDSDCPQILVIESPENQLNWMSPSDPTIDVFLKTSIFVSPHNGCLHAVQRDGSTKLFSSEYVSSEQLVKYLTVVKTVRE